MTAEPNEMPPQDSADKEASGGRRPSHCSRSSDVRECVEVTIYRNGYVENVERERDAALAVLLKISEIDYDDGDIWTQAEAMQALAHNAYFHVESIHPESKPNDHE